jgi:hypothetical protein
MKQEFDFFIEENLPTLHQWAEEVKCRGGIVVGSSNQLIETLQEKTKLNDEIICNLSGAWLDVCIADSVRKLLYPQNQKMVLPGRIITEIRVNLPKCMAFEECRKSLTLDEKRKMFETTQIGNTDNRLKILM